MSDYRTPCTFCKIIDGSGRADIVYQNDSVCVIKDFRPSAERHLLAVSREHIKHAKKLTAEHKHLVENMVASAQEALRLLGDDLSDTRYGFYWPPFHSICHLHLHALSPASRMGVISRGFIFKQNSYWFVSPEFVLSRLTE